MLYKINLGKTKFLLSFALLRAFSALWLRLSLFWSITQRRLVVVTGVS